MDRLRSHNTNLTKPDAPTPWSKALIHKLLDAAPYAALDTHQNYALLINAILHDQDSIHALGVDPFQLFVDLARRAPGYAGHPVEAYQAQWDDLAFGAGPFRGMEFRHAEFILANAKRAGWAYTPPVNEITDDTIYGTDLHPWPYPLRTRLPLEYKNPNLLARWARDNFSGYAYLNQDTLSADKPTWFMWGKERQTWDVFERRNTPIALLLRTAYQYLLENEEEKERKHLVQTKTFKEVEAHLTTMTKTEKAQITMDPCQFNTLPHILPVQNGYIDLRRKTLLNLSDYPDGFKSLYFTQRCPVPFFADAPESTEFLEFLRVITLGRQDLMDDLRNFMANALWGGKPSVMGIFYGVGANGKTTLSNILYHLMEPLYGADQPGFAVALDSGFLMLSRNERAPDEASPVTLSLKGKRFALVSESTSDQRLNLKIVKNLYSDIPIKARRLYSEPTSFYNHATIIMSTNHLLNLPEGENDFGTQRRFVVFPFDHVFPDLHQKSDFAKEIIEKEGPAILRWLIDAPDPHKESDWGLTVQEATQIFQNSNNTLGNFFTDCIEATDNPDDEICSTDLYKLYKYVWCEETEAVFISAKLFNLRIKASLPSSCKSSLKRGRWYYYKVRIREPWDKKFRLRVAQTNIGD